jgi:uroporphyrin-3 C-methyltransferase
MTKDSEGKPTSENELSSPAAESTSTPNDAPAKDASMPIDEPDTSSAAKSEQKTLDELEALMKTESKSEQTKTNKPEKAAKPVTNPTESRKQVNRTAPEIKKPRNWLGAFAFLISIIAVSGTGVAIWYGKIQLDNQQALLTAKQQAVDSTQQNITQLQSQLTQIQNSRSNQVDINAKYQNDINAAFNRIKELSLSQPNYWLAAEANFLIQLAERRLLIEQDVQTAIQLLIDANQRLTAMNDPSVFPIREAISEDVASLYAVKQPNTDDIYLTLSGLSSELANLPFAAYMIPEPTEQVQEETVSDDINDWQTNLSISVKRFFEFFVDINHHEKPIEPQLPPQQKWYIVANLNTQITMAQRSSLDFSQARYQDALDKIILWTKQYFDVESANTTAFLNTAIALKQQSVAQEIPEQLRSQALIANFINSQLSLKGDNNG